MRYYTNANDSDNEDAQSASEYTPSSAEDVNINTANHYTCYGQRNGVGEDEEDNDTEVDDEWHKL